MTPCLLLMTLIYYIMLIEISHSRNEEKNIVLI